jgi:hypothetical protein
MSSIATPTDVHRYLLHDDSRVRQRSAFLQVEVAKPENHEACAFGKKRMTKK